MEMMKRFMDRLRGYMSPEADDKMGLEDLMGPGQPTWREADIRDLSLSDIMNEQQLSESFQADVRRKNEERARKIREIRGIK